MTLREWCKKRDIDPLKGLAVHPASDGFKIGRDNLMSVSATGSWPDADIGTAYVAGADASKVREITEVDPGIYDQYALPLEEAVRILTPVVKNAEFLVIWYAQYSLRWMIEFFPDLMTKPTLDLVPVCKALDQRMEFPADVDTIEDLNSRLSRASFHVKGGYKFDEVCGRMIPGIDGDTADAYLTGATPKLERQVYRLYALYTALLDR
jgi:hypothetical protein